MRDITDMAISELREHFKDFTRDQLLLAIQTREQWAERIREANKQPRFDHNKILNYAKSMNLKTDFKL